MKIIEFDSPFQRDLLVDITHHDSNEEPEESCTNKLASIKLGERIYHYFDMNVDTAVSKFTSLVKAMSRVSPTKFPDVAYCVSTRFCSDFSIDLAAIERHYQHRINAQPE